MTTDQYLVPADEATPSAPPHDLAPAVALAELRDALADWIADALESTDGRVHDPDRGNAHQITNSLYVSANQLARAEHCDGVDDDLASRFDRVGRHLRYAAEQADTGRRIAASADEPFPYQKAAVPGYIQVHYGSAVAYVRQARDFFQAGRTVVTAITTQGADER